MEEKKEEAKSRKKSALKEKNINTEHHTINERTIGDTWRSAMWLCILKGYDYIVEEGSYIGQIRRELSNIKIVIREPGTRPLAPITPPNIPPPTDEEKIAQYFLAQLMNDKLAKNEQYVYGTWIKPQLPIVIEKLVKSHGNTNQACITVGNEKSILLEDPPCLKLIDFKVVHGKLNMSIYFRSWDLISALPQNLGGLQLLKEYVAAKTEFEDREIIAYSGGLHIYEQYFDIANRMNVDKIKLSKKIQKEKEEFSKELDKKEKLK